MIVYEKPDKRIALLYPAQEFLETKGELAIALKDTPEGCPFWIVPESEIPTDFLFSDAWEIPEEWGAPDGYGLKFYTFEEVENALNQS
jgi:hypothetical protein